MILYFSQLSEKDKRHYAALEATKLGDGGKTYLCKLFGISQRRIRTGEKELNDLVLYREIPIGKQRK